MELKWLEYIRNIRDDNMLKIKEARENGDHVVGIYCAYSPRELVMAAGAIPVSLCGTSEEPIPAAEKDLPRNLCPLIKSSYGFAVTDTCPYFHMCEILIGETTCDGKKKMFELLGHIKPVHVMNLPRMPEQESSLELWYRELLRLKMVLEQTFQVEITDEVLWVAIRITNEENRAIKELFDLNRARPALISGSDLITASYQSEFATDNKQGIEIIDHLVKEIKELAAQGYKVGDEDAPRILLTGTPVAEGTDKVVKLVEELGGLIVAMENCGGYKTVELVIDENDDREPLRLLAEKYLQIPCSVMSPNTKRLELIERMVRDFQIDGVIDLTWQACHTYNVESYLVSNLVKNKLGLPFMQLETDYSSSDLEVLRVRVQAFLEIIQAAII
ncbi:MAG: double-cubane-cluster-containing anaerobic reductase [Syntrophomonas sp.]